VYSREIDGVEYAFPINPLEYDAQEGTRYGLSTTINDSSIRFEPYGDPRKRVMRWRGIPNRSPYTTMIPTLFSSIGISGVRLNHRDIDIRGDQDEWRNIWVENVEYRLVKSISNAINNLRYDIDFVFTYE